MKKILFFLLFASFTAKSQSLYFPPTTGSNWDTMSPTTLNWCQERIDSLYSYLEERNTDAFIVLKGGKIVLEKYYGTFTKDSVHYWASAGKSLTAMLTGIAQERGLFTINDSVSNSLATGWTTAPGNKEGLITLRHLLTMTSGLNDTAGVPCNNEDTSAFCLRYLADAGTRWAYHTGAYRKLQSAISNSSGLTYNAFTSTYLSSHTGMSGFWYNGVYYSNARSMARFGLLALNKAIWSNDTLLHDTGYYHAMVNTSQSFNPSYGYLWWLNGKSSYMAPGSQFVFTGPLIGNAPADMFCALGKNDQKIYVVPSKQLVVVRMGGSAYGVALAFSPFDDELWGKIDSLGFGCTTNVTNIDTTVDFLSYPNPVFNNINLKLPDIDHEIAVYNFTGKKVYSGSCRGYTVIDCSTWPTGIYKLKLIDKYGTIHYENITKAERE